MKGLNDMFSRFIQWIRNILKIRSKQQKAKDKLYEDIYYPDNER